MAPHAEPEALTDTQIFVKHDPITATSDTHAIFTIDDVLPHRAASNPPARTVAAFSDADMFKSKGCFRKPKSRRWDHRLSEESKARAPSSLKGAMKFFREETISLCGGLPSR
jgi:aromatic amino acid aminotransferase I / 2-aminoadipate transaminase